MIGVLKTYALCCIDNELLIFKSERTRSLRRLYDGIRMLYNKSRDILE